MDIGSSTSVKSEMNITPLVDVVLVLLIIFMVITPVILQETTLYLPKVEVTDAPPDPNEPGSLVVKLNASGAVALRKGEAEEDLTIEMLAEKLSTELKARTDKSVFLDASTMVAYAQVATVFDVVKGTGAVLAVVETDDDPEAEAAGGAAPAPAAPTTP